MTSNWTEVVESFLGQSPRTAVPTPYVWLDGLTQKVREGGRIVNVCVNGGRRGSMPKGSVMIAGYGMWVPSDGTARSKLAFQGADR